MSEASNQQIMSAVIKIDKRLDGLVDCMATKDDLKAFATKDDLNKVQLRLERKIRESKDIQVKHLLAAREDIGNLTAKVTKIQDRQDNDEQEFTKLKTGLARAVGTSAS